MTQVPSAAELYMKKWPYLKLDKGLIDFAIEYAKLHREAIMQAADQHILQQGYTYAGYDSNAIRESYPIELIK